MWFLIYSQLAGPAMPEVRIGASIAMPSQAICEQVKAFNEARTDTRPDLQWKCEEIK